MSIPEKRSRFLQELEAKVRERKIIGKGETAETQGRIAARAAPAAGYDSETNKIRNIITSRPVSDSKSEEIFSCLNRLEERIDLLDAQMKRHFGNSKLVESEISRLVSDKWESLSKETDECLTRMTGEMQDLRDIVIGLRSSVRSMEK